jgi:glycosyltransferase involved in cell wall biosynthesis
MTVARRGAFPSVRQRMATSFVTEDSTTETGSETTAGRAGLRIAVIFDRFGPYHIARLDAVGRRATVIGIEVAEESAEYAWSKVGGTANFDRRTLFSGTTSRAVGRSRLGHAMAFALDRAKPDVVALPGWSDWAAFAALAWCIRNRAPAIVMSASTTLDAERLWLRESAKRRIVSLMSAGLAGGSRAAAYLAQLGMRSDRIFIGYDVVDNKHFALGAADARRKAGETRTRLGLPPFYFLACSRFVPKKNLSTLLRAYARYCADRGSAAWKLVLVGDGELKPALQAEAYALGIADDVVFPGFAAYHALPAYYGLASAFVLASTVEQWGLVVNEAMASVLPVLVSDRCGCAPDLVENGVNGFTFDPHDVGVLASLMVRLSRDCDLEQMGDASARIVDKWTPNLFAENLLRAAIAARRAGPPRPSFAASLLLAGLRRQ